MIDSSRLVGTPGYGTGGPVAWTRHLDGKPEKAHAVIVGQMEHRLEDIDFAGVRGREAMAKLPETERKPWQKLWDDVANTLPRALAETAPWKKSGVK